MRKDFSTLAVVSIILITTFIAVFFVIMPNLPQSFTNVRIGDGIFKARLATTETDRQKGLSGVDNLSPDQALLMVFPSSDKWGIWMKDMKIPIDIIWLNENKQVVYIVKNAVPEELDLRTFIPKTSAKYVLELAAGSVDSRSIKSDSTAVFQLDEVDIQ